MKRQRASKWNKVRSECVCVKRIKVFFFMKKKDEEKNPEAEPEKIKKEE